MNDLVKHRCPACGHPVLPKDPLAILPPTPRAVFDLIYRSGQVGITRDAIAARVWLNAERAPESSSNVSVHVCEINKRIKLLNLRIVGEGKPKHYRVVSTHDNRDRYKMRPESAARRTLHNGAKCDPS